ncbi:Multifunctional non-ous end joining protein LigD [Neolecta irregularis DAH-3]|uniref:Multifunctional non-ous end joining protein LigD n=1 Tax=Neolecta irregularis (strain DAH-3) TaxID=1198029 RepID=A0A1U7LP66_NEOID|nr:Multifunctional non-ous end joining protein LigD [Neolecta irregularis DAH-3]|eukprot:OLL24429.1 Multifunctional non-ous end joining protein LigD [Neolecta irregularis DAH-3]
MSVFPPDMIERFPALSSKNLFCVQVHDATRLHFDLRLQLDGTTFSWAIPKGMRMLQPGERRLAVQVNPHPLDYTTFEGVIPKGSYGAGAVLLFDIGHYQIHERDQDYQTSESESSVVEEVDKIHEDRLRKGIASGKLTITLRGEHLKDVTFKLILPENKRYDLKKDWILLGLKDAVNDEIAEIRSVRTGRNLMEVWQGTSKPT